MPRKDNRVVTVLAGTKHKQFWAAYTSEYPTAKNQTVGTISKFVRKLLRIGMEKYISERNGRMKEVRGHMSF